MAAHRRAYEAAIAAQDSHLRELFDGLESRGRMSKTLIIVTSDHGEEFYEHRLMRHGNSLYNAAVHVPLVVAMADQLRGGTVVSTPVSVRSIATTIAAVTGTVERDQFDGPNLLEIAEGAQGESVFMSVDEAPNQPPSFPVHHGPLFAVIEDGYKYIVDRRGVEQLFALADKDERTNLALSSPAILTQLRERVQRHRMRALPD